MRTWLFSFRPLSGLCSSNPLEQKKDKEKETSFRPLSGLCSSNHFTACNDSFVDVSVPFRGYVVVISYGRRQERDTEDVFPSPFGVM